MRSARKILTDLVEAHRLADVAPRGSRAMVDSVLEEAIQWQRGHAGESDCCTECGREQLVKHMECPKDDPANLICGTCHARHIKEATDK